MTEKTRTMIVEDQPLQRQITENALNASGRYEVLSAIDNADLADLYVDSLRIELVLMDVFTALGADGLAAAERIKEQFPGTKVIITTSMPESAWIARAKAAGVESFWFKEVDTSKIVEICDRTMAGEQVYPA